MKARVKVDVSLMAAVVLFTVLFYLVHRPGFYTRNIIIDDVLDCLGFILILKGVFIRMVARGYKKEHSSQGQGLVMDGPYSVVRNPMYLGTFLIGSGFVLLLWPWWMLPVFWIVFYLRFNKQMVAEEKYLLSAFGTVYETYCRKVPRFLPIFRAFNAIDRKTFPWENAWNTQEKWGLAGWIVPAFVLEAVQQKIIFGTVDILETLMVLSFGILTFSLILFVRYRS